MALQFGLFLRNDFIVLLLLFWLFSLAMTSFGYLLSTFVRKAQVGGLLITTWCACFWEGGSWLVRVRRCPTSRTRFGAASRSHAAAHHRHHTRRHQGAMYLGFAVFIVGWVFQSVIFLARLPYTPATYFHSRWGPLFFWVFSCLPWNPLTKGILDLNAATLAASDPGARGSRGGACGSRRQQRWRGAAASTQARDDTQPHTPPPPTDPRPACAPAVQLLLIRARRRPAGAVRPAARVQELRLHLPAVAGMCVSV
jgi:hypothetical protein